MAEKLLDSGPMGKVVKTYLILVDKATKRQTIRFGDLAKEIGVVPPGVGVPLTVLYDRFLKRNDFPDLTAIVVRVNGEPVEGKFLGYPEREKVYDFPWMDYAPPTIAELEATPDD